LRRGRAGTKRSLAWRLAVPAVFTLVGVLFVTSATTSGGADLRAGRYSDLRSLVRQESVKLGELQSRSAALQQEVSDLAERAGDADVDRVRREAEALNSPAGLESVSGPGVTVTLDDAPEDVRESADVEVGKLVVHQQDIQAVANALWAGGAEAMTIQGQRVISTTGIKCVGNTVVLHGVPYSPPYVVTAVGDRERMLESLEKDPYLEIYRQWADAFELGWDIEDHDTADLPAYDGPLDLEHARAAS
jgi:uncharacterized protein YlxW (UPF0749 family)